MVLSRVLSSLSRTASRRVMLFTASQKHPVALLSNQFHCIASESPIKLVQSVSAINHSSFSFHRLGISSSATPEPSEKENGNSTDVDALKTKGDAKVSDETNTSGSFSEAKPQSGKKRRLFTKEISLSDSDSEAESDLSTVDWVKLVGEKDELLQLKSEELKTMQDNVLRAYAEMENVRERTRREAENAKKFAIQNFAKSLLDVADNMERASSVVKTGFAKFDVKDSAGATPLLKTLLEGVEMTEKQLLEVFKQNGVEKYDPINEPFDPNRHNAAFQVPDNSKPADTVAVVLKPGYNLYDRVIRPAEVGVTVQTEEDKGSKE